MTIHKIVGKHTTGDVRDYVGSAGELFYDDTTGLIRLADGVTAGGNALKLNEFEDQFVMMATSGSSWPELATSISNDGVRWTQAFSTTEFVDIGGDYEYVEFYQTAIGGGKIVYLGYDYNTNQNCLFWADAANQAGNRSFSPASYLGDEANSMENCLWIEDVQFINDYFIAVGYQERYEPYNGDLNYVKYPYWAYSSDGEHWQYGNVDYSYVRQIIDAADADIGNHTYGFRVESVGGGGNAGILFTMRFYSNQYSGSPGFFYLNDAQSSMNPQSYSGLPNFTDNYPVFLANYGNVGFRSVWHDDHGWIVWSNFDGSVYFNDNTDPRDGKWRTSNWWQVAQSAFGYNNTCIYWAAAGRLKDGYSYVMMTGQDGRYYATRDQGRTWLAGVVGGADYQAVHTISTGANTVINFSNSTNWYNNQYYDIVKVKITDSNIEQMNGIFFAHRNNYEQFVLYDLSGVAVDSTDWGSYNTGSATCTFSYGNRMDYLTYGAGTFIAVDYSAPFVWSVSDLTTDWNWDHNEPLFDTGNTPNDWDWKAGNWTATIAQNQFDGPWAGIGCISFGRIGTHSGLLRSDSRRISGRTNVLNLADNFSVSVMNGVQGGENLGIGTIELRPGLPGGLWSMGTSYWQGPGTAIYSDSDGPEYTNVSIDVWNPNNGDGATWTFKHDGIYYGGEKIVSAP